jgi:hypothetical protein
MELTQIRHIDSRNSIEYPKINSHSYSHLLVDKTEPKTHIGEKTVSSQPVLGKADSHP